MRKIAALLIIITVGLVNARSVSGAKDFLKFNPDARIIALGGAGSALKDTASPLAVNPASAGIENQPKLSFFYGSLSTAAHCGYIEYSYPFTSWAAVGAAGKIEYTDENNYAREFFFGASLDIFNGLSVGGYAGLLNDTLDGNEGEAITSGAGLLIYPFKWLGLSGHIMNLNSPVIEYESITSSSALTMDLRAGISIYSTEFFSIVSDVYLIDIDRSDGPTEIIESYGVEIHPFPALSFRGGFSNDNWRAGLGIKSKNLDIDYAYINGGSGFSHYFQYTRKFGAAPTVKEKELHIKEETLKKKELYLKARTFFNKEDISQANRVVEEYVEIYGADSRIEEVRSEIKEWLNKKREEHMGLAEELKKDILRDYYSGRIRDAERKLANMKLLAPNYDQTRYLDYLLSARVLLEKGEYREAENKLVEALKINPDSSEVIGLHKRLREVLKLSEQ